MWVNFCGLQVFEWFEEIWISGHIWTQDKHENCVQTCQGFKFVGEWHPGNSLNCANTISYDF